LVFSLLLLCLNDEPLKPLYYPVNSSADINEISLGSARKNIKNNNLSEKIALLQVSPDAGFFNDVLKHAVQ